MVTINQVRSGIDKYATNNLYPKMPATHQIGLAFIIKLYSDKLDNIARNFAEHPSIKPLGIIQDGNIDLDTLYRTAKEALGSQRFELPSIMGLKISIDASDIDALYNHIISS